MFEIKKTEQKEDAYRLIIYRKDMFNNDSVGYVVERKELYDLYSQLRQVFKNLDEGAN